MKAELSEGHLQALRLECGVQTDLSVKRNKSVGVQTDLSVKGNKSVARSRLKGTLGSE